MPDKLNLTIFELLIEAYPHAQLGDNTIRVYEEMLADIPDGLKRAAVLQHIATSPYFPTVAAIRELAFTLGSDVSAYPESWQAWGEVVKEIGRTGSYGRPSFKNPMVARAVEIMGWWQLCTSENAVADRAHFVRVYEQLINRAVEDAKLLPVAREIQARALKGEGDASLQKLISNMTM